MSEHLPSSTVATYASAVGPVAILGLPFSVYLPPFIAAGGGVPVAMVGLVFSLSTIWDGLVDPLIGNMVDRKSSGDAPHRRWMLRASLPLALLLVLLVFWGDSLSVWLLLPLLLLFYSCYSLYEVAHLAWGAALADNPDDSTRLFGNREFGAKLLLILAFAAPALAQWAIPGLSLQGRILAYVGLLIFAFPLALWAIHTLPARPIVPEPGIGWAMELKTSLRTRPLILLLLVQFLGAFSFGALTATFLFYADGYLKLDAHGSALLFGSFVGGALFTPLWIQIARRLGKPQAMVLDCAWLLLILAAGLVVPPGNFMLSMLFSVTLGSGFAGLLLIHGMVCDLAPHDRTLCGRDRSAFLFAITHLVQKGGNATAVGISFALLGAYGFDATNPGATPELVRNLFTWLPFLGWSVMLLVALLLAREPWVNQRGATLSSPSFSV
jgi:glycoside/pentoside/hexuronide:cation symporter, GPH family